ncbi:MAG: hypothetical protein ACYTE8_13265 [Planctomycetota bacterium]|jgi:hypothetical protein
MTKKNVQLKTVFSDEGLLIKQMIHGSRNLVKSTLLLLILK